MDPVAEVAPEPRPVGRCRQWTPETYDRPSALMAPVLRRADDEGLPCHLHTSDAANVAYYGRFGFEVTSPAVAVLPGGPGYVGMTRPPSGTRTRH